MKYVKKWIWDSDKYIYNCMLDNGNYISNDWFEYIRDFCYGWALVKQNNKYNYINKLGEYISEIWFDYGKDFISFRKNFYKDDGSELFLGVVKIKNQTYYIDQLGNVTYKLPNGYSGIRLCYNDGNFDWRCIDLSGFYYVNVKLNGVKYKRDINGNILHCKT